MAKRQMTAEGRKRISDMMKARWRKAKREKKNSLGPTSKRTKFKKVGRLPKEEEGVTFTLQIKVRNDTAILPQLVSRMLSIEGILEVSFRA